MSWKNVLYMLSKSLFSALKKKKMHPNTINNIPYNYCTDYGLDEGKHLEKMKELVKKHYPAKFNIYVYICDVVGRVQMHEKYFFCYF